MAVTRKAGKKTGPTEENTLLKENPGSFELGTTPPKKTSDPPLVDEVPQAPQPHSPTGEPKSEESKPIEVGEVIEEPDPPKPEKEKTPEKPLEKKKPKS